MTAEEFAAMERRARMFEAANEKMLADNKRLREENARLREALEPFAPDSQWIDPAIPDGRPIDAMFLAGELRAARAAIREGGKDE